MNDAQRARRHRGEWYPGTSDGRKPIFPAADPVQDGGFKMTTVGIEIGKIASYCNKHKCYLDGEMTMYNESYWNAKNTYLSDVGPIEYDKTWSPDSSDQYCPMGQNADTGEWVDGEDHACNQFWVVVTA